MQFAIQERDASILSGMHDAHCPKEYAVKMTELDEQSGLGHQDHLSIGEVRGSTHLESKDVTIHKSDLRIIKSMGAEESISTYKNRFRIPSESFTNCWESAM